MHWENERYVRVYVRDTVELLALGWEGRALLWEILRKADRAGVVPLGKAGARGLAALTGIPAEVVDRILPVLISDGCVEMNGTNLVVPNFIEAQEASMSGAARQRECRERRRDQIRSGLRQDHRAPVVYFIQSENGGHVKIGRTDDLAKRLQGLSTGRPDELVVVGTVPGTADDERRIHDALGEHRDRGEWFHPHPAVMAAARAAVTGATADDVIRAVSQVTSHKTSQVTASGHDLSTVTPCCAVPSLAEPEFTHTPPAHTREEQAASQDGAAEVVDPGDPDVPVVLAHLASMPFPVRHMASRQYAERFVCAKMAGLTLGDILAGITSAALKLGKHASATADQPETIIALADHVGGFIANQKRVGRRAGAIPLDDPDGVRRTQAYFGKVWEQRKRKRYGAPEGDLDPAAKLWDYAKKCAADAELRAGVGAAPDAEAHVRNIVGQYLADRDRFISDQDHPLALLIPRLGRYGLPSLEPVEEPEPMDVEAEVERLRRAPVEDE